MKEEFQQLKKLLPGLKKSVSLANYTTFKIGGSAKYFFEAKTNQDLIKVVSVAKKVNLPFFILGGGSNILVSDEGFEGLVIRIKNQESRIKNHIIYIEAGAPLGQLVDIALKNSLSGLEWAAGIPGTVGGAVYGNAGTPKDWVFGRSIGDQIESVTLLMPDGKIKIANQKWMKFSYRESRLKNYSLKDKPIILSAVLKLKKGRKKLIEKSIKEKLKKRAEKIPPGASAGCVFKNPPNSYAGLLIDKCGLKGEKIGGAQISEKHANFIINLGGAKAKDVLELINLIKKKVKEKFEIELEEEIQFLGF